MFTNFLESFSVTTGVVTTGVVTTQDASSMSAFCARMSAFQGYTPPSYVKHTAPINMAVPNSAGVRLSAHAEGRRPATLLKLNQLTRLSHPRQGSMRYCSDRDDDGMALKRLPAFRKADHWLVLRSIVEEQCRASVGAVNPATIEQAMEQWFVQLEHQRGEHEEALQAIGYCLKVGDEMGRSQFQEQFKKISSSDTLANLFVELCIMLRFNQLLEWQLIEGVPDVSNALSMMIHCGNGDGIDRCLKHLPDTLDLNGLIGGVQDDEPWAESFLHKAVKTGYFDVVSHLVSDERICIDCQDECGATPLLLAALSDDPDMTRLLLRNEANPLLQNFVGESPLSVSIDGVAARSMYDIEKNQWSIVAAEYATEQRYDILDQLISALDAMSEVGAVDGVDGVDVAYLDQLIFRLISCDRVQRDNLKKMFQVRERLEPDNTLYAKSAKLIEPMFAIGHKENLDIALQEFQTLFGTSSQRRELIEAYGRSDLNAVFNIT